MKKSPSASEMLARKTVVQAGTISAATAELERMRSNPPEGVTRRMASRALQFLAEVPELRALRNMSADEQVRAIAEMSSAQKVTP